ncbi:hypothetical protein BKA70DRAFT_1451296 [Coprinopsis sp. MPI-PUGE-AT-0042]|nr:hypothetical protein BKA70DRAFT_1451296 [Coprinopsis sp. MPI-PUGE-AT-0042]
MSDTDSECYRTSDDELLEAMSDSDGGGIGSEWLRLPAELKTMIMRCLGLGGLKCLALVDASSAHQDLRLRVKSLVARAGLRIADVIDMMRETSTVISGSGALVVIVPCSFVNEGLDFFCPFDERDTVFQFFRKRGYGPPKRGKIISMSTRNQYSGDEDFHSSVVIPSSIEAFYHLDHEETGYRVSIVQSRSMSAIAPILGYHSTILMNWISWDGISCLYPALTMDYLGLTTALTYNHIISDRVSRAIARYRNEGFTLHERCLQIIFHSPDKCFAGRAQVFKTPDGLQYWSKVVNPYCKRSIREINGWGTLSMSFDAGGTVADHDLCVTWKLSMLYLGKEGMVRPIGGTSDSAWVSVQDKRYYQYNGVKSLPNHDPDAIATVVNEDDVHLFDDYLHGD